MYYVLFLTRTHQAHCAWTQWYLNITPDGRLLSLHLNNKKYANLAPLSSWQPLRLWNLGVARSAADWWAILNPGNLSGTYARINHRKTSTPPPLPTPLLCSLLFFLEGRGGEGGLKKEWCGQCVTFSNPPPFCNTCSRGEL